MSGEVWRTVARDPRYEVSSLGRVRFIPTGHVLKATTPDPGYPRVSLGESHRVRVHQLVAEAFIGPRRPGMAVNHIDGVKTNNAVENLEYVTYAKNNRHAYEIGLWRPRGKDLRPRRSARKVAA